APQAAGREGGPLRPGREPVRRGPPAGLPGARVRGGHGPGRDGRPGERGGRRHLPHTERSAGSSPAGSTDGRRASASGGRQPPRGTQALPAAPTVLGGLTPPARRAFLHTTS